MEVNGIPGLHVADASVMPSIPRTNTHAATIMIAERAAQLMRKAVAGGSAGTAFRRPAVPLHRQPELHWIH
jgi:choline dehydrogenase